MWKKEYDDWMEKSDEMSQKDKKSQIMENIVDILKYFVFEKIWKKLIKQWKLRYNFKKIMK